MDTNYSTTFTANCKAQGTANCKAQGQAARRRACQSGPVPILMLIYMIFGFSSDGLAWAISPYRRFLTGRIRAIIRQSSAYLSLIAVSLLMLTITLLVVPAVRASAAEVVPMITKTSRPTAVPSPFSSRRSHPSTQDQLRQLEIRQLRQQTGQWAEIRAWLPALTALVGLIAAAASILTYLVSARRDRQLRLEDKVEENIGTLVAYPTDHAAGVGKLNNALRNLQALLDVRGSSRLGIEQRVCDAIVEMVLYDLDLNDVRQARFDAIALDNWPSYRRLLRENSELRNDIFYRYVSVLRSARIATPDLYKTIRVRASHEYQFDREIDDAILQQFGTLLASYCRHMTFAADSRERDRRGAELGSALNNPELAIQLLGDSPAVVSGRA